MLAAYRQIAPAPIVTVEEMKAHSVVEHSGDDDLMDGFIQAATEHLDGKNGLLKRCIGAQSWVQPLAGWPSDRTIRLPFPDVSDASIVYDDADTQDIAFSSTSFELGHDGQGAFLRLKDNVDLPTVALNSVAPIRVTFTAGFGEAADVPAALKTAVKLLSAHWHKNREGTAMPDGVMQMISPFIHQVI